MDKREISIKTREILRAVKTDKRKRTFSQKRLIQWPIDHVWDVITRTENYSKWVPSLWEYPPLPSPTRVEDVFVRRGMYEDKDKEDLCMVLEWKPPYTFSLYRGRIDQFLLKSFAKDNCEVTMNMTTFTLPRLPRSAQEIYGKLFDLLVTRKSANERYNRQCQLIAEDWLEGLAQQCDKYAFVALR